MRPTRITHRPDSCPRPLLLHPHLIRSTSNHLRPAGKEWSITQNISGSPFVCERGSACSGNKSVPTLRCQFSTRKSTFPLRLQRPSQATVRNLSLTMIMRRSKGRQDSFRSPRVENRSQYTLQSRRALCLRANTTGERITGTRPTIARNLELILTSQQLFYLHIFPPSNSHVYASVFVITNHVPHFIMKKTIVIRLALLL
jgi:hypothetical protein